MKYRDGYWVALVIGAATGVVVGGPVFPVVVDVFGDPSGDVMLAVGGAALTALGYEVYLLLVNRQPRKRR